LFICSAAANASEPFFTGLGDLRGGGFSSEANGVSADGSVVVGVGRSTKGIEAFRWTQAGGMVGLGDLAGGDFASDAHAVSDDGLVVVGSSLCTVRCSRGAGCRSLPGAFRWTSAGGMTLLGDNEYGSRSIADGVSADGSVVVGTRSGTGIPESAFRWTPGTVMEYFAGGNTALGVSPDGAIAVGFGHSGSGTQALRWTMDDGMLALGSGKAYGVSADGSVIVGIGTGSEAFRWTQASGMVGIGILPGFIASLAQDVSADGSLVVGYSGDDWFTPGEAFLWDASHGMRSLRDVLINDFGLGASLAGWTLTSANDISADGQFIVGSGTNPNGNSEAWIARLVPELALPGDFNHDSAVDAADYAVWRKNPTGNYTQSDYNIWRTYFGASLGPGSGAVLPSTVPLSAAVPEPAPVALVWIAATSLAIPTAARYAGRHERRHADPVAFRSGRSQCYRRAITTSL
jgi:probable HAF family extracellular repeat protein